MAKNRRRIRARTEQRRRARASTKRGNRVRSIATLPGEKPAGHFYDDCPICRAMKETGLQPDAQGVVHMDRRQEAAYQQRLSEIVAKEGWPDDAQFMTGEEMFAQYDRAEAALRARGYSTDMDAMSDEQLEEHLRRLFEQVRDQGRQEAQPAARPSNMRH